MDNFRLQEFDLSAWAGMNDKTPSKGEVVSKVKNDESSVRKDNDSVFSEDEAVSYLLYCDAEKLQQQISSVADHLATLSLNIAESYGDWLRLGFALVDGLGEGGRSIYHNLSRMSTKYQHENCDKQYDNCLRSPGHGITYRTFFQMAKDAGVDLSQVAGDTFCAKNAITPFGTNTEKVEKSTVLGDSVSFMPGGTLAQLAQSPADGPVVDYGLTFSDQIKREDLPSFLYPVLDNHSDAVSQDKMLLGVLNLISGILPMSYYGIYDKRVVYPPLYNIIYGGFATSKGELEAVKQIVMPVKQEMRRKYDAQKDEYDEQHALWESRGKKDRGPEPKEPTYTTPFVTANSSASAVYRGMDANEGWGVMFETEADTLTNMLSKSEYGDYSDLLRKAHHHEAVAMVRVADKVNIEIDKPRLSVFLTCTGSQLPQLLSPNNVANGLASRFLFYALPQSKVEFHDVFAYVEKTIEDIYKEMGLGLMPLYHALQRKPNNSIQFSMSPTQQKKFVRTFQEVLFEQFSMLGEGFQGFVYRLALECYRYAMILTILRRLSDWNGDEDNIFHENEQALSCDDRDLNTAMEIINCLVNHTGRVFAVIGGKVEDPFSKLAEQPSVELKNYYLSLPSGGEFKTADAVEIAIQNNISERTAKRYLGYMVTKYQVLAHPRQGEYKKIHVSQTNEC